MGITAIVTMPPYAPFMAEVLRHPIVSGISLNTVMPVKESESLDELVKRLGGEAANAGKELWVDLKARQLRIATYGVPPFTEIQLSHRISVDAGAKAYFADGKESATIAAADGNRLIMLEGPKRFVGPGESVNIPHHSLKVEGYLTDTDKKYAEACTKAGLHSYMLSFVEGKADVDDFRKLDEKASVIAKIESRKGLAYVASEWSGEARLMAARGDLYHELKMPHHIIRATQDILAKDSNAVAASRIFPSLAYELEPSCTEIGDVDNLLRMGYRTLMFGDDICMQRDSIISGLNLLKAMGEAYER